MEFGVTFDFEQFENIQQFGARRQRRRSSLPPRIQSTCESSDKDHSKAVYTTQVSQVDQSFSLTDVTLDYLTDKSELVAVLAALVTKETDEERTPGDVSDTTTGSVVQEQIRNFRFNKMSADFPELYEHIKLQVLPLETCKNPELEKSDEMLKATLVSALSESFRTCLLSSPEHYRYYSMLQGVLKYLLEQRRWSLLIDVLNNIPGSAVETHQELLPLKDFVLCCLAQSVEGGAFDTSEGWRYLLQISDPMTKTRAVLGSLKLWSVDVCLQLLNDCVELGISDNILRKAVQVKTEEINVYQKVSHFFSECIKDTLFLVGMVTF